MAHIGERKRKDGSVCYRAHVFLSQDPVTGKQRTRTKVFASREEADAWAADQKLRFKKGTLTEPCRDTLAEYGRRWLDGAKDRVRHSTWRAYCQLFRAYVEAPPGEAPNIGRVEMQALRPEHVRHLYAWLRTQGRRRPASGADKGLSRQTVGALHAVLRQMLYAAFDSGAVEMDLAAKLRRAIPRERGHEKRAKALTKEQLDRFLDAARTVRSGEGGARLPDRYFAFWYLLAATGMRPGEGLSLTWADVDLICSTVHIWRTLSRLRGEGRCEFTDPKTKGSRRVVALPASAVPVLEAHRQSQTAEALIAGRTVNDDTLVFTTESGMPVDWTNLTGHFFRIMRRAGLGTFASQPEKPRGRPGPRKQPKFRPLLPPYCLRHTHATLSLAAGVPVKVVSERLGHASTAFTMDVYADALPHMQVEAAKAWDELLAADRAAG